MFKIKSLRKMVMVSLLCGFAMQPVMASASSSQIYGYGKKNMTPERIVDGGFEATGKVVDGAFRATDNILFAVLSVPLLPLYLLNEAMEAPARTQQKAAYEASHREWKQKQRNRNKRNAKTGDRLWKQY